MTVTHTGAKLHRLAAGLGDLPAAGMVAVARASKRLVEAEARAAGVGTMRLAGRARGPRQQGPARPRRTVRLKSRDTIRDDRGTSTLRVQAVPVGPWVWANTGTDAHYVGRLKGRGPGAGRAGPARIRGAWVRGAAYKHGVQGPVLHPGTAGKGAWRKAADKVTTVAPTIFTDELAALVRGVMASEQVNVDLTATDKDASKKVDALADKVDDLEKQPAEVEVTADTSKAVGELKEAADRVEILDRADAEVVVKARIDALKSEVDKAEGELRHLQGTADETGDHVAGVGGGNKVNAIRDLTGPLGEVSGQLGDMGESFTAAGELIEEKMGLAAGSLTNFLGPLGLAAGAVFAFWQMYKSKADEAKKATQETAASIEELGATAAAQKKLEDMLKTDPGLLDSVQKLGLKYGDLFAVISGKGSPAFDLYRQGVEKLQAATEKGGAHSDIYKKAQQEVADSLGITTDELGNLRDSMIDTTDALDGQAAQFAKARDIADKLAVTMAQKNAPAAQEVERWAREAAGSVHSMSAELDSVPADTRATVTVTDNGTAATTKRGIDDATKPREVVVTLVDPSGNRYAPGYAVGGLPGTPRSAPMTTNVTITAPRGVNPADLIAAGERYARRNGGRATRARR